MGVVKEDAWAKVVAAVREHEAAFPRRSTPRPGVVDTSGVHHEFVQINSTTLTSGRYQGQIAVYNTAANTWSLLGSSGAIWVVTPNGETLSTLTRYEGRLFDSVSGVPVFLVDAGLSTGGGGALTANDGARLKNTGTATLTSGISAHLFWDTVDFDTTGNFRDAANHDRLLSPSNGSNTRYVSLILNVAITMGAGSTTEVLVRIVNQAGTAVACSRVNLASGQDGAFSISSGLIKTTASTDYWYCDAIQTSGVNATIQATALNDANNFSIQCVH